MIKLSVPIYGQTTGYRTSTVSREPIRLPAIQYPCSVFLRLHLISNENSLKNGLFVIVVDHQALCHFDQVFVCFVIQIPTALKFAYEKQERETATCLPSHLASV